MSCKNGKNTKRSKNIRADKTSREAFKITAGVSTSSVETVREVRTGKDVKVS
jgi:hypothetical protein